MPSPGLQEDTQRHPIGWVQARSCTETAESIDEGTDRTTQRCQLSSVRPEQVFQGATRWANILSLGTPHETSAARPCAIPRPGQEQCRRAQAILHLSKTPLNTPVEISEEGKLQARLQQHWTVLSYALRTSRLAGGRTRTRAYCEGLGFFPSWRARPPLPGAIFHQPVEPQVPRPTGTGVIDAVQAWWSMPWNTTWHGTEQRAKLGARRSCQKQKRVCPAGLQRSPLRANSAPALYKHCTDPCSQPCTMALE